MHGALSSRSELFSFFCLLLLLFRWLLCAVWYQTVLNLVGFGCCLQREPRGGGRERAKMLLLLKAGCSCTMVELSAVDDDRIQFGTCT